MGQLTRQERGTGHWGSGGWEVHRTENTEHLLALDAERQTARVET